MLWETTTKISGGLFHLPRRGVDTEEGIQLRANNDGSVTLENALYFQAQKEAEGQNRDPS